jgi:hypothetical protein
MGLSLDKDVRNQLARTTLAARGVAETAAKAALENFAVHEGKYRDHMSGDQRSLRNRLRARGRSVGDARDGSNKTQEIPRLTELVAYENWHRLLFTRFLTENNLLVTDAANGNVPITLAECDDLAPDLGARDGLDLACRFASEILPGVFRKNDPALEVPLAINDRVELDRLLNSIPRDVFTSTDGLGWTYQYWQAEKKDAVNASGDKIGADELPAVTQLFTEDYMVEFLHHNTIGAWHAGKVMAANPSLAETAQTEDELRQAVKLKSHGGYDFDYLRFVREAQDGDEEDNPTGPWRPASGVFEGWPTTAKELKVLDPCCGSGHFLVEGFELLVRLRMDEEGLSLVDSIRGVLADNLHGLEIDPRCTQIAAFNVALTAWKLTGEPIDLPPLHIACSGLGVDSKKSEWTKIAGDNDNLKFGMESLYDLFKQAPELGSLIDPNLTDLPILDTDFSELQPLLEKVLSANTDKASDRERAVSAQGMAKAAELLASKYTLAITNVPYLGRKHHGEVLVELADRKFQSSKADLATIFIERLLMLVGDTGTTSLVVPQNWLFLTTYKKLREHLLSRDSWNMVVRLGAKAFQTITGEVVNVALVVIDNHSPKSDHQFFGMDVSDQSSSVAKSGILREDSYGAQPDYTHELPRLSSQALQLNNPDARITLTPPSDLPLLSSVAASLQGTTSGDNGRFVVQFWESSFRPSTWKLFRSPSSGTTEFGGSTQMIRWDGGKGELVNSSQARVQGQAAFGKRGVLVGQMATLPVSHYFGEIFDMNGAVVITDSLKTLEAIWCLCQDSDFLDSVRRLDQKLNVTNATIAKIPFDLEHWQKVAEEKYPNGLPEPYSEDPTQWLFHGHPAQAEDATVLQVAVARLLGYKWPSEQDSEMRLSDEARDWIERSVELNRFADSDGIVCLPSVSRQQPAAPRLRELLAEALGTAWNSSSERDLISATGSKKTTLEEWLADDFFGQHTKIFHNRPFIWQIWDGRKDGFSALVNYHLLDYSGLQSLTYTYLGEWITRQDADANAGKPGAAERLVAARALQAELARILEGQTPYDIFVRWKSISEQPVGWRPDLNDGVRLNIRPFMNAQDVGKKGAGILRGKPNIKWGKDRGKEPQSLRPKSEYPWFWHETEPDPDPEGEREFTGNRWNDVHLTLTHKQGIKAVR